jgi:ribose 1,5-bisphosphokinase
VVALRHCIARRENVIAWEIERDAVLVLVVGASGVGKDTLLNGAKVALAARVDIVFPKRIITRERKSGIEDHVELSENGFAERADTGGYALHWRAHNRRYGVSIAIEKDLKAGRTVVVNASREVVAYARARYPALAVIHIVANPHAVEARLKARGREEEPEVEARLARGEALVVEGHDVLRIVNDGTVEEGVASLIAALEQLAAQTP